MVNLGGLNAGQHEIQLKPLVPTKIILTNFGQLPKNSQLELSVDNEQIFGHENFLPSHGQGGSFNGNLPGPGQYLLYVKYFNNEKSAFAKVNFNVDQDSLTVGAPIQVDLPSDFIAKILGGSFARTLIVQS